MATIRDESGPRLRQVATALAYALFHLRDQRDKTCFGALLDISITILPLIPTDQDDGRVVSDIRWRGWQGHYTVHLGHDIHHTRGSRGLRDMGGCLGVGRRRREPFPMYPMAFPPREEVTYPMRPSRRARHKGQPRQGGQFLVPEYHCGD